MTQETTDDDADAYVCDRCGKPATFADTEAVEDGRLCLICVDEWQSVFNACQHEWEHRINQWGEPAGYCRRCAGTVALEDFPALGLNPSAVPPEAPANAHP